MSEVRVEPGSGLGQLTAGDWIGVALAILGAVGILFEGWVLLPTWEAIFRDLGARASLPLPTAAALWGPLPYLAALPTLGCLAVGLAPRGRSLAWRRAWIVAAFLASLAGIGFFEWTMRLPFWQLADAVKA